MHEISLCHLERASGGIDRMSLVLFGSFGAPIGYVLGSQLLGGCSPAGVIQQVCTGWVVPTIASYVPGVPSSLMSPGHAVAASALAGALHSAIDFGFSSAPVVHNDTSATNAPSMSIVRA